MVYTLDWRVWIEVLLLLLAGIALCRRFLPLPVATTVVALRLGFTVLYFERYFHGYWVGGDGPRYFYGGMTLLTQGFNPITALTTSAGLLSLQTIATGSQITYFWWNLLLEYFFGARFCVPVLCNTGLTFLAAYFAFRTVRLAGAELRYARIMGLVLLVHPEIVAYSSIANYKDVLVYCLTVIILYLLLAMTMRARLLHVLALALLSFAALGLRFYVPIVALAVFGMWTLLHERGWRRWLLVVLAAFAALGAARYINFSAFLSLVSLLLKVGGVAYGFMHMLLTPRPYALPFWESFLFIPAVCNWAFMPLAPLGAWGLWRASRPARFLLLYLLTLLLVFSFFPFFQEYREQFQYYYILIWAQFHGGWMVLHRLRQASARLQRPAEGAAWSVQEDVPTA